MALARRDRFKLKAQLIDALEGDEWTFAKTNLLFREFNLETLDASVYGSMPTVADIIAEVSDEVLPELYTVVMDIDPAEVENVVGSDAGESNWKAGYARIFLSHSTHHKQFVGELADQLAIVGVHGFVAHDTIAYSKPWQAQIEQALRSMQGFVALVHPEFKESAWCNAEVGWALGRRVPHFAVRMGAEPPPGFLGREQWPSGLGRSPEEVAVLIGRWLSEVPELGSSIVDGLLSALGGAGNFFDAEAKARRIAALGSLTDDQFARLDRIWWSNDQLHGGILPTRVMEPFYRAHGRVWPPLKEQKPYQAENAELSEEPF